MPRANRLPGDPTITRNDSLLSNDVTGTVTMSVGDLASFVKQEIANAIGDNRTLASIEGHLGSAGITTLTSNFTETASLNNPTTENSFTLTAPDAVYVGRNIGGGVFENENVIVGSILILSNANQDIPAISGVIKNIESTSRRIEFEGLASTSQLEIYGSSGDFLNTLNIVRTTGVSVDGSINADNVNPRIYLTGAEYNALSLADNLQINVEYAITDDTV